MEQSQPSQPEQIPHIIQVYTQPVSEFSKMQSSNLIQFSQSSLQSQYEQPNSHHINSLVPEFQQHIIPPNVIHTVDYASQSIHSVPLGQQYNNIVNEVVTLQNGAQYYSQAFKKEQDKCLISKNEPVELLKKKNKITVKCNQVQDKTASTFELIIQKRKRHKVREPSTWACNIRKLKHQKGEAYIDRRGKFVPEKTIKNTKDCLKSCILKCSEHINDTERQNIFKAFYSLQWSEKKHFILNSTERNTTKISKKHGDLNTAKRKYIFKYFFTISGVKHTVCKQFYLGTLAISQKPVYNVHNNKSELNIPKPDGRGLSDSSVHALDEELKNTVRNHIMSFKTIDNKPVIHHSNKKQYLEPLLNFKKMYKMYVNDCKNGKVRKVKESMYRKILKNEFNLDIKKIKQDTEVLCSRCKTVVKKEKM